MYLYLETGEPLGNIGEFSFIDTFEDYSYVEKLYLKDDKYIYAIDTNTADLFDQLIEEEGDISSVINSMSNFIFDEIKPDSYYDKYDSKPPGFYKDPGHKEYQNNDKELFENHPKAYKFLNYYISGTYTSKDKLLHNIPTEVDSWCKTQPKRINVPLYRGIQYSTEWFNNEVERLDNKNKILHLKTDSITSWSTDINISNHFFLGGYYMLLELVYTGEIYCDLRKFNPSQEEVLLYPGRYKTKIVKNFFRMVKKEVDTEDAVGEDAVGEDTEEEGSEGLDVTFASDKDNSEDEYSDEDEEDEEQQ